MARPRPGLPGSGNASGLWVYDGQKHGPPLQPQNRAPPDPAVDPCLAEGAVKSPPAQEVDRLFDHQLVQHHGTKADRQHDMVRHPSAAKPPCDHAANMKYPARPKHPPRVSDRMTVTDGIKPDAVTRTASMP